MTRTRITVPEGRRAVALLTLGIAAAALVAGTLAAQAGMQMSRTERQAAVAFTARFDSARNLMPEVQRRERFAQLADEAVAQSQKLGFDPAAWAERRLTRVAAPISRGDANHLLRQVGGGGSEGLFAADNFELSVLSPEASLFRAPALDDKGLSLAMSGVLYFPLTPGQIRP